MLGTWAERMALLDSHPPCLQHGRFPVVVSLEKIGENPGLTAHLPSQG